MSGGRKFLTVEEGEKTPEEKLTNLEAKLPVLIERIQSYDGIVDTFESLEKTIGAFELSLSDINRIVSNISNCITMLIKKDEEISGNVARNASDIEKKTSVIVSQQVLLSNLLDSDIQEKQLGMSNLCNQIKFVSLSSVAKEEFNKAINSLRMDVDLLKEELSLHRKQIKDLNDTIKAHSDAHKTLQHDISLVDAKVTAIDADFSAFPKELNSLDARIMSDMNKRFLDFFNHINSRLDQMSVKLIPQGVSLAEIKSSLDSKIETFKIDVSNCLLKSGNNSQQINLLDKKLEHLRLLMNKYFIESNVSISTLDEDHSK